MQFLNSRPVLQAICGFKHMFYIRTRLNKPILTLKRKEKRKPNQINDDSFVSKIYFEQMSTHYRKIKC